MIGAVVVVVGIFLLLLLTPFAILALLPLVAAAGVMVLVAVREW